MQRGQLAIPCFVIKSGRSCILDNRINPPASSLPESLVWSSRSSPQLSLVQAMRTNGMRAIDSTRHNILGTLPIVKHV
ncbi:hypothetical protein EVAR_87174_1 [Eumeta japonica]|uniref:Uncharacterized protein n=1 Tax=Eumeta variegata TaxID=151549 RepID=A0A4C1VV42_EUMVA|nr:hypothetical protein EVAR_87174_1 [Eumeta japonica]